MLYLKLYTKDPCPLCDELKATLDELRLTYPHELEEVDITATAELNAKYRYSIPVLENAASGEKLKAPITLMQLTRFLTPSSQIGF